MKSMTRKRQRECVEIANDDRPCPNFPITIWIEHVLPYLDRASWNAVVAVNAEIWRSSRMVIPPWPLQAKFPTSSTVQTVQLCNDWIASGCRNGEIIAWHVRAAQPQSLRGHNADEILALEFLSIEEDKNVRFLVSMSHGTICVWNFPSNEKDNSPVLDLQPITRVKDVSLHLCSLAAFSPLSKNYSKHSFRWVSGHAGLLSVWDYPYDFSPNIAPNVIHEVSITNETSVLCLAVSSTSFVACGCFDRTIQLFEYNHDSNKLLLRQSWGAHRNKVKAVAFSPCGTYLASGSLGFLHDQGEATIRLWDLRSNCCCVGAWSPSDTLNINILSLCFIQKYTEGLSNDSAKNLHLATAGMNGQVQLWTCSPRYQANTTTRFHVTKRQPKKKHPSERGSLRHESDSPIYSIVAQRNRLVSGCRDETVRLWSLDAGMTGECS